MTSTTTFRAFVSYCHADRRFAARLHGRLESYRLPRRLEGAAASLAGHVPGRIGPIFRDRADLSAAEDLSAAVRDAIARSSALIVVASPAAARSRWIDLEIALFRELHPAAPILVALVAGEPAESLPPALLLDGVEPLAADFRTDGDGRRLAFLKIVAGLAGLPLDTLVQRDAQRQLRRVTAVTLGAGVVTLVMAGLLVMALQARSEAERQRASAEGLVEFMLTTLREELKGTGRPQVMAKVDARAMEYYGGQGDLAGLPDTSLDRRARVLHAIGEDDDQRGDIKHAQAMFAEARQATAAILARRPRDGDAIFAHAQSEYWVGYAAWRKSDRATTTRYWRGYLDQANALAEVEKGSVRSFMEQGYAEGGLCDLEQSGRHDLDAAKRHCEAATGYVREALRRSPNNPKIMQDLANRYGWLRRVLVARGEYAAAHANLQQEIALLDRLLDWDPDNAEYLMRRTWADLGLAAIWLKTGEPKPAVRLLRQRRASFEPKLTPQSSDQFWDTGARLMLLLAKAERLANDASYPTTASEAERIVSKYVTMFPSARAHIVGVRQSIDRGE